MSSSQSVLPGNAKFVSHSFTRQAICFIEVMMSAASNFHPSREVGLESRALSQAQELRPVVVETLDLDSPEFKAEVRRQTLALANSEQEKDDLAFIDSIATWPKEGQG